MSANGAFIAPEVDPARVHPDAVIHPGCRISGARTSIGPDCEIGAEAPVTLRDCQLGRGVKLGGGFADGATFLDGASFACGFHIRPGTLVEEHASGGHCVGLKQTVLFPFVTLGSLINFCDILMAGGDGSKNHSEVGSSYIHFNFTPHQDKATASLAGDVPRGVLLREKPIFLGGQGGMAGPCRIAYGTVAAAGVILRKDVTEENQIITGAQHSGPQHSRSYDQAQYGDVARVARNCFAYLRHIGALARWYSIFRAPVMRKTAWGAACHEGALERLAEISAERIARLDQLSAKLRAQATSGKPHPSHEAFVNAWTERRKDFEAMPAEACGALAASGAPDGIAEIIAGKFAAATDYVSAVRSLDSAERAKVRGFLEQFTADDGDA